jgi:hypothetical protein
MNKCKYNGLRWMECNSLSDCMCVIQSTKDREPSNHARNKSGKDNIVITHGIMRMINGYEVETDEKPLAIQISKKHWEALFEENGPMFDGTIDGVHIYWDTYE